MTEFQGFGPEVREWFQRLEAELVHPRLIAARASGVGAKSIESLEDRDSDLDGRSASRRALDLDPSSERLDSIFETDQA